jgi:hypothetical protein
MIEAKPETFISDHAYDSHPLDDGSDSSIQKVLGMPDSIHPKVYHSSQTNATVSTLK